LTTNRLWCCQRSFSPWPASPATISQADPVTAGPLHWSSPGDGGRV
jgi:hypothetical protein